VAGGAHSVSGVINYAGSQPVRRDLLTTTPSRAGNLNWYHPALQEALIDLASMMGAQVRRGVTVAGVTPGRPVRVGAREHRTTEEITHVWSSLRMAASPKPGSG
jgi:hypothetical protein